MRRTQAAKQDGTAARNAEQFKLNKYKHTTITPVVAETHGRLGDHAKQVLRLLRPHDREDWSTHTRLLTALSTALQKTNAAAIKAAYGPQTQQGDAPTTDEQMQPADPAQSDPPNTGEAAQDQDMPVPENENDMDEL
jgi:hypothetical protein